MSNQNNKTTIKTLLLTITITCFGFLSIANSNETELKKDIEVVEPKTSQELNTKAKTKEDVKLPTDEIEANTDVDDSLEDKKTSEEKKEGKCGG